jgi:WD40 repeat protein
VYKVVYSPDGKFLLTGSHDRTARTWDAQTGKEILTLTGHLSPVYGVAVSPDGKRILTCGSAGFKKHAEAKVWRRETGRPGRELVGLRLGC